MDRQIGFLNVSGGGNYLMARIVVSGLKKLRSGRCSDNICMHLIHSLVEILDKKVRKVIIKP